MATTKKRGRPPVKTVALKSAKVGDKVKYRGLIWTVTDKMGGLYELTRKFGKKTDIQFTDLKTAGNRPSKKTRGSKGRPKIKTTPLTRAYAGDHVKYEGKIWEVYEADAASVSLKRTYAGKTYYRRAIDRKARKAAPKKAAATKTATKKKAPAKSKAPKGTKKAAQMSLFGKSTGAKAQSSAKGEKVTHKGKKYLVVDSKGRGDARTIRLQSVSSNRAFTMLAKNLTP